MSGLSIDSKIPFTDCTALFGVNSREFLLFQLLSFFFFFSGRFSCGRHRICAKVCVSEKQGKIRRLRGWSWKKFTKICYSTFTQAWVGRNWTIRGQKNFVRVSFKLLGSRESILTLTFAQAFRTEGSVTVNRTRKNSFRQDNHCTRSTATLEFEPETFPSNKTKFFKISLSRIKRT